LSPRRRGGSDDQQCEGNGEQLRESVPDAKRGEEHHAISWESIREARRFDNKSLLEKPKVVSVLPTQERTKHL
jgi:hypothetical protein